ncbi:Nn.00g070180.m01.CDS01 [Neocucurbitaria sp. VM-36]
MDEPNMHSATLPNTADDGAVHLSASSASSAASSPSVQSSSQAHYIASPQDTAKPCYKRVKPRPYADSIAQRSSSSKSNTIVDDEINEAMAESWSAPTHVGSDREATSGCFTLQTSPSLVNPATQASSSLHSRTVVDSSFSSVMAESWSASTFAESTRKATADERHLSLPANNETPKETYPVPNNELQLSSTPPKADLEKLETECVIKGSGQSSERSTSQCPLGDHLKRMGKDSPFTRWLMEDPSQAPWTIYHLRTSGTVCSFCGSSYTGPDHKQKAIDHTREMHLTPQGLPVAGKARAILHPKGPQDISRAGTAQASVTPSTTYFRSGAGLCWPAGHPLKLASDLNAIGTKWQDELSLRTRATKVKSLSSCIGSYSHEHHPTDPKVLLYSILSILNTSDSGFDSERANDFFNGLDLVADDLKHRFPRSDVAQGMQDALASLESAFDLDSSRKVARTRQRPTAPSGARTCPASQNAAMKTRPNSSSTLMGASRPTIIGSRNNGQTNGQQHSSTNGSDLTVTVRVQKRKPKLKTRLLACTIRKDDEVHGRFLSCHYEGAANMSSLKQHLMNRDHRRSYPFIDFCRTCSEYVVDGFEWQTLHETKQCIQQTGVPNRQIRGFRVGQQWQGLYQKMFLESERLPSPYVDDPTWRPKMSASSGQGIQLSILNETPEFNFNEPRSNAPFLRRELRAPQDMTMTAPTQANTPPSQNASDIGLEPMTIRIQHGDHAIEAQDPRNNQAFLDEDLSISNGDVPPIFEIPLQPQIPTYNMEATGDQIMDLSTCDDGFDLYYDQISNEQPSLLGPSGLTHIEPLREHDMVSPLQDPDDAAQTATLLFILEQCEELAQPTSRSSSQIRAQRIEQANSMSRKEFLDLADKAKANIEALAEQIRAEPPTVSQVELTLEPSMLEHERTMATLDAMLRSQARPMDPCDSPQPRDGDWSRPADSLPELFAPATWNDAESLHCGSISPDPTRRTFFPEMELSIPSYE